MLSAHSRTVLQGRYTHNNEKAEDIFRRVAEYYGSNPSHTKRLLQYFEDLWLIPASPILANGGTGRALPISCFLTYVPDSREGLVKHFEEVLWMGMSGGGVGSHWSDVRSAGQRTSRGTVSTGAMQFIHVDDAYALACNQGSVRQSAHAIFLRIDHPEILEHKDMRKPTGGDVHRKSLNLHHGVVITDAFMEAVECDEEWPLIDPHSKETTQVLRARDLWFELLETRAQTGEPYFVFIDECNRKLHPDLKEQGLTINGSNLCVEITLPTNEDRTAVCCLSSVNLEKFDEWKDVPGFVEDAIEFLDNVLEDFINTAPPQLAKAVYSAIQERSIGLGTMGFHAYLQEHSIPIGTPAAIGVNLQMFSYIKECALRANVVLAAERGPAEGLKTDRFSHMLAIAPNASTAIIAGTSPSIEPWSANIFVQKTVSGALTMKNKTLDKLLSAKALEATNAHRAMGKCPGSSEAEWQELTDRYLEDWWREILNDGGSVQNLDCLDEWEKDVFKTAVEINQMHLIKLAADRAPFICQSQSLNLFFPSGASRKYVHKVHMAAWRNRLKTLYYMRTIPIRTGRTVTFDTTTECESCSG